MPVNSSTRRGLETAPEAAQLQAQPRLVLEVRAASPTVQQVPTTAGGQRGSPSAKGGGVCRRATEMAPGVGARTRSWAAWLPPCGGSVVSGPARESS